MSKMIIRGFFDKIGKVLFNMNSAYTYSFLSGILMTIALKYFIADAPPRRLPFYLYGYGIVFLSGSISAFILNVLLETARGKWQQAGCPLDRGTKYNVYVAKGWRRIALWLCFIVLIACIAAPVFFDLESVVLAAAALYWSYI